MNASTQHVERRPGLAAVFSSLSAAGMLLALGAGCQSSPAPGVAKRESTTVPVIVPAFDPAKTVECWAKLCVTAEEWRNAIDAVHLANPLPQIGNKPSEEQFERFLAAWAKRTRAMRQTSGAFNAGLTHLPVFGVHKDLVEHIKLLHSIEPVWQARIEAEDRNILENQELWRKAGGGKAYWLSAQAWFGAAGQFILDKVNNPVAESNAFRDGKAELQKLPAKWRKSVDDVEQAQKELDKKFLEISTANVDVRSRLSNALGKDLPPIPLR